MRKLREKDGRVHFSSLKEMAKSAAHYKQRIETVKAPTLAMRRGTCVDRLVFGGRLYRCDVGRETKVWLCIEAMATGREIQVYPGKVRNGGEWEKFAKLVPDGHHAALETEYQIAWQLLEGKRCDPSTILSTDEYDLANRAAEAVRKSPVARPFIENGEHQVVVKWELGGLECAAGIEGERGGFDSLGPDFLADLKVTQTTEPDLWKRQATRMLYPEQLAFYRGGAESIGRRLDARDLRLIGVEIQPPNAVTVLRLTGALVEAAERQLRLWTERLRACELADEWPEYAQSEVDFELDEWGGLEGLVDESE